MMRKFYLYILLFNLTWAIVPTIDQHQLSNDITTMTTYASTIGAYLNKIGKAITVADQVRQLHGLQQIEAAGRGLCDLCSPVDIQNLQVYINNINDDLCSQFSFAMQNITGLVQGINSLNDVISQFQTNPQAAGLALQRASVQTQVAMQNTLTQVHVLMAQETQKKLAEQKLERQMNDQVYKGFHHSGL